MFSINKLLSKGHATMTASGAAFFLSIAIISSASAADVTNIATTYDNSCAACHDSGALNAIKKGDSTKWQQLIEQKSMPTLIQSVKGGMTQMPAGGLCDTCSDDDYRKLIEYMSQ